MYFPTINPGCCPWQTPQGICSANTFLYSVRIIHRAEKSATTNLGSFYVVDKGLSKMENIDGWYWWLCCTKGWASCCHNPCKPSLLLAGAGCGPACWVIMPEDVILLKIMLILWLSSAGLHSSAPLFAPKQGCPALETWGDFKKLLFCYWFSKIINSRLPFFKYNLFQAGQKPASPLTS